MLGSLALLSWAWRSAPPILTRGPYLQSVASQSLTVVCRTDAASALTLRYGAHAGPPWEGEKSSPSGTVHVFALSGLRPETSYAYEIVAGSSVVAGGPSCSFRTSPPANSRAPFRFLAWGDSGTGSSTQLAVAARMEEVSPAPGFALALGDLVYEDGDWADYDPKLFEPYSALLPRIAFWPTLGNHDVETENGAPYFDAFYLPTTTGAPGHPSNTERYYSFDHGMAHFACADSELSSSSPGSAMYEWLDDDLADARARGKRWLIVFLHRPPHSRGTHDSTSEGSLIELREDLVPLFESHGVDLVAAGHSHNYERSFLARDDTVLQADEGDYTKIGSPDGTIYLVSGCGGKTGSGPLDHPLMARSYGDVAGFSLIDVSWEELRGSFVERDGETTDIFTVHKASDVVRPRIAALETRAADQVALVFDEPVRDGTGAAGAENLASYVIEPARAVLGATLQSDLRTVLLRTASLQPNLAYRVSVTSVQDVAGNAVGGAESGWVVLAAPAAGPPVAVASTEVQTANAPARIAFSSARSSDGGGPAPVARWDFGDGSATVAGSAVEHLYGSAGRFTATLIVADSSGLESVDRLEIRVHSQGDAPLVALAASPSAPDAGENVAFSSAGSRDPDGGAIFVEWDFGDPASGVANRSTSPAPTHAYAAPGSYTAVLTAVDDEGSAATRSTVISVGGSPPQDTTAPLVTARSPAPGASSVPASSNVSATFDEPVQGVSGSSFTLRQGSTTVAAQVGYDAATRTATLDPSASLAAGATYTASLTGAIRDLAGNALAPLSWTFTVATGQPPPSGSTFSALADAQVRSSSPSGNYGSDPALRLRAGDPEYRSYLRFQVAGLAGGVSSATLRLFVTDGSPDAGTAHVAGASWSEGAITWGNAPPLGAVLGSAGAVDAGEWAEYDVTALVTGDGTYAFGLSSASENSAYFSAREGANPPQLVLEVESPPQDTTAPLVTDRDPPPGASSVPASTDVSATFDEPVQGVSGSSFTLRQGSTTVAAQVGYDAATRTATLDPTAELAAGATYTASLSGAIRDLAGNALAPLSWTFTVAAGPPPPSGTTFTALADAQVRSSSPSGNYGSDPALRVRAGDPEYRSYVRFSVAGLAGGVSSATLRLFVTDGSPDAGTAHVAGTSWSEGAITWGNAPPLGAVLGSAGAVDAGEWAEYDVTAHVTGDGTYAFGLSSASENSAYFSAREGANPPQLVLELESPPQDTTAPLVTTRSPAPGASSVPASTDVSATFDEPVQGVSGSSFTLRQGSTSVAAQVAYDAATRTATLDPTASLAAGATYTASLTGAIRDLAGNALAPLSWSFTVAAAPPPSDGETFQATADATVRSNGPNSNFGSETTLRVRSAGSESHSYVRFDVSGLSGDVTSATLRLYVSDESDDGGSVHGVSAAWSEGTITWRNAPPLQGSALDSAGAVDTGEWIELDVTSHVVGNGVFAFALSSSSDDTTVFSSREGSRPPELVIETAGP